MTKPSISLIITTYNSADVLEACLQSIRNQTTKDFELIVVDEASKDATPEIAKKYADKFINEGKERCQKRNIGADNASADYVFFIDSDMQFTPTVVEECIKHLAPDTLLMIPEVSFGEGFWSQCKSFERAMYVGQAASQGVRVYPKKLFIEAAGFDEKVMGLEDLDLFYRIQKMHPQVKTAEVKSHINHDEGDLKYKQITKRMYFICKSFNEYKRRHPEMAKKQTNPITNTYLKHWKHFAKHPVLSAGFVVMKGSEGISAYKAIKAHP